MVTAPTSPQRPRAGPAPLRTASLPAAQRSLPSSAVQPTTQEWNGVYTPVTATIERSPSANGVSPIQSNMRWAPGHQAVSPPVTEPDRNMMHPPMDQQMQAPQVMDQHTPVQPPQQAVYYNTGMPPHMERPVQYATQQPAPMVSYAQIPSPVPSVSVSVSNGYDGHARQTMAPQMTPSPAYAPYPTQQEYLATSPHEVDGVMSGQPHHMMYLPHGMKPEH